MISMKTLIKNNRKQVSDQNKLTVIFHLTLHLP